MGFWTPVWRAAVEEDVDIIYLEEVLLATLSNA